MYVVYVCYAFTVYACIYVCMYEWFSVYICCVLIICMFLRYILCMCRYVITLRLCSIYALYQVRKYVKSELSALPHWVPRRISRVLRAMLKWDPKHRPSLRQVGAEAVTA